LPAARARFLQLTDEIGRQVEAEAQARSPDLGRMIDEAAELMAIINALEATAAGDDHVDGGRPAGVAMSERDGRA
jgi:hypothetical protein